MSKIPDPSLLIQYYELITYVRSHTDLIIVCCYEYTTIHVWQVYSGSRSYVPDRLIIITRYDPIHVLYIHITVF